MVNVITYSFISIFCLLINNFSFVLSIIALQSNNLKQKNLQNVTTNSKYNNSIENEVESESANTIAKGYKDCTEALINKTRKRNILIEYKYYEGYYLYPSTLKQSFDFIYRPRLWSSSSFNAKKNGSIYRWEVIDCENSVCLRSASFEWPGWYIWSIPGKNGRPAPYSPQLRESNFDQVKNDNKFKFVVQCLRNCDDHIESGFGNCEIVNYCTAKKENTTIGYKLYAGWHSYSPETFLRMESAQGFDNDWFSWQIHIID